MSKPNIRLVLILITSSFTGVLRSGRTFALDVDLAKGLIDAGGGKAVDENYIVVANETLRLAEDPKYVAANDPSLTHDLTKAFPEDDFELLSADEFNAEFYPKAFIEEALGIQAADEEQGGDEDEDEDDDEDEANLDTTKVGEADAANVDVNMAGGTNEADEDEVIFESEKTDKVIGGKQVKSKK